VQDGELGFWLYFEDCKSMYYAGPRASKMDEREQGRPKVARDYGLGISIRLRKAVS